MPFTLAHPAAVWPLRKLPLMATAPLILGSLTPDLATYVPWRAVLRPWHLFPPHTHSLLGTLIVDLPVGMVLLWLVLHGRELLAAPLWQPHRRFVLTRLNDYASQPRWWLVAPIPLLVGSWTHILLDSFTHENRFMVRNLPMLSTELLPDTEHPLSLYHFLQYFSSLVGLVLCACWYAFELKRDPSVAGGQSSSRPLLLMALLVSALLLGLLRLFTFPIPFGHLSIYQRIGLVAGTAMVSFFILYACTGYGLLRAERRRSRSGT